MPACPDQLLLLGLDDLVARLLIARHERGGIGRKSAVEHRQQPRNARFVDGDRMRADRHTSSP